MKLSNADLRKLSQCSNIEEFPTVDPYACEACQPKEPFTKKLVPFKKSHWEWQVDGTHFCANCGRDALYDFYNREICTPYCPQCGAFMKKGGKL